MKHPLALAVCTLLATSLSAQNIAHFDFESQNVSTTQPAFATVSDLSISNTFVFGGPSSNVWLCLTTAWNNSGGTISFTVTPDINVAIDYGELSWDAVTGNASISDSVRSATIRANGIQLAVIDPLTHATTEAVDLTAFGFLQAAAGPVTFEIDFEGNPTGQSAYEVGQMRLTGAPCAASCCPNAAAVLSIGSGCAPSTATVPAMISLSPPVIGGTFTVGVDSPSSPNNLALLVFGFSTTFNPMFNQPLPISLTVLGFSNCSLYSSGEFLTALLLDNSGRATFSVTPPGIKWCGGELTFQAFSLTLTNQLLATQGLTNVMGN